MMSSLKKMLNMLAFQPQVLDWVAVYLAKDIRRYPN
jgi:hypothetical protein